jgi:hypothetical protein
MATKLTSAADIAQRPLTMLGTVNLSNPRAIFAGSRPRFTRSRLTYEAYVVSRTSTRPQVDSARAPPRRARAIPHLGAHRPARGLDPFTGRGDPANRLAQQTRISRIGHIGRHHRGVHPDRVGAQQLRRGRLGQQASLSPFTAADPHRVVSFITVVGCGTAPSSGIRQNRRQVIESVTSRHSDS